jgi:hypothetical protein
VLGQMPKVAPVLIERLIEFIQLFVILLVHIQQIVPLADDGKRGRWPVTPPSFITLSTMPFRQKAGHPRFRAAGSPFDCAIRRGDAR